MNHQIRLEEFPVLEKVFNANTDSIVNFVLIAKNSNSYEPTDVTFLHSLLGAV